jgi:hypothetical protein
LLWRAKTHRQNSAKSPELLRTLPAGGLDSAVLCAPVWENATAARSSPEQRSRHAFTQQGRTTNPLSSAGGNAVCGEHRGC